ncbi:MAG TPA: hypothetical protein PLK77_04825 [Pyrinomonadaceae bacterium]|nr:hypothetical protein [Pyrinomonadaceae bacterium]
MTTISAELPDALLRRARTMAEREGLTLDQFLAIALSGQLSSWDTARSFEERASRGSWAKMRELLANAPDVEPEEYDKL